MKSSSNWLSLVCAVVWLVSTEAFAEEILKTPYGAEWKGNKDGSIPEWQGQAENKETFGSGVSSEKPLYVINASNVEEYKSSLPKGLQALAEKYPETFSVPVYKSYRPAYYPDWVYSAIAENKKHAKLADGGDLLLNTSPGIPFPEPTNGYHVMWNHLLAYKGVSASIKFWELVVHPKNKTGLIYSTVTLSSEYYNKHRDKSTEKQMYMYYLSSVSYPPSLAGSSLLIHERVNAALVPRQAWAYITGQRRVVRVPTIEYDSPMPRAEGIRFADEIDIFNGALDRYQWRLIGKEELIIPYNNNRFFEKLLEFDEIKDDLFSPYHLNPDFLRYEKHRVWKVEGVLKQGKSHPYKKRIIYMDEDSWGAVLAENYDRNDELWRVSASYVKLHHKLPAVFKVADVFHDLKSTSYYAQGYLDDNGTGIVTSQEVANKADFKPSGLRRKGVR